MTIKYQIYNGTPPYTVTLLGTVNQYNNIHLTNGNYQFESVLDDSYLLYSTDNAGCIVEYGTIDVNNTVYKFTTVLEDINESEATIDLILIKSKIVKHRIDMVPLLASGTTGELYIIYDLITTNTPVDPLDDTKATASFNVLKNGVSIFFQTTSSDSLTPIITGGTYTITDMTQNDLFEIESQVITREEDGEDASGLVNIEATMFTINNNLVPLDTSGFIVNTNIA